MLIRIKGVEGSMDIRVRTFNELGLNAFSNKNNKLALEYFEEALRIDPKDEAVLLNKSKVFIQKRSLVEAIATLDGLLVINSKNQEAKELRENCLDLLRKGSSDIFLGSENEHTTDAPDADIIEFEILVDEDRDKTDEESKMIRDEKESSVTVLAESKTDLISPEKTRTEAIRKSNEIIKKVAAAEKKGIVIVNIKQYLDDITANMDSGNPDRALEAATRCLEHLERTQSNYNRSKRLYKRAQQNILDLRSQGANVDSINQEMENVPELLKKGEYDKVTDITTTSLDRIANRKIVYQDALDAIRDSWQVIKEGLKEGIRDHEADEELSRGRKFITKGDYEKAIDYGKRSQDVILTSITALKKLREEFHALQAKLAKSEALGMNVSSFQEILLEIDRNLKEGGIDLVDGQIFKLKDKLGSVEEEYNRSLLLYQMTKFKVDEAKSHGVDTSGMEQSLNTILREIRNGNYDNIPVITQEIQNFVNKSKSVQDQNKALLAIEEGEELYEECRNIEVDVSNAVPSLKKSKLFFNEGNFKQSCEFGRKAIEGFIEKKLLFLLKNTRKMIEELDEKKGLDREVAREDLVEVGELIQSNDLDGADELIMSIRRPLFEEKAKDQLIETQEKINEVAALGGDMKSAKRHFEESQKKFTDEDYEGAYRSGELAWESAESAKLYEELIDELKSVREYIDKLEADGIDVREAKSVLTLAKPALENKFYQTAMDHSKHSKELADRAKEMHEFVLKIEDLGERLDELKDTDADLEMIREDLSQARKMIKKGKKGEIESILYRVEDDVQELENAAETERRKEAKKLKKEGNDLFKEGNAKAAIRLFNRALKIAPRDETIIHNKGVAYKKLKMYDKALRCTRKVLSINPDYSQAITLKRLCEKEIGKMG